VTAETIIRSARERGIILSADSGRIRHEAPGGALTPDLVAAIRERRAEVLALLEVEAGVEEPAPAEVADQAIEQRVAQETAQELREQVDQAGAHHVDASFEAEVERRVEFFANQAAHAGPVPLLVVPGSPDAPGGCLSCGQALVDAYPPRCRACIEAAHRVLARRTQQQPQAAPGGPPEVRTACCPACGQGGAWKRIAGPGEAFCLHCGVVAEPTGPGPPPPP
jgi:hypothetical protein